jgi:hypothetical protein
LNEEEGWVTGPAIDVLVQGRGIQVGDELKVTPLGSHSIEPREYRAKVTELEWGRTCIWNNIVDPKAVGTIEVFNCRSNKWLICRENLIAWRRPKKVG